jgi:hypothetical protein
LDVGPSILFLIFALFEMLWVTYDWQSSFVLQVCQPF